MSTLADLDYTVGLLHSSGKYLTAQPFGSKMNISATSMGPKSVFTLEQAAGGTVFLKTSTGTYVNSGDGPEGMSCEPDSPIETAAWTIEAQPDGSWALRDSTGFLLGGGGETTSCFTTELEGSKLFTPVLAMHPQVCIKNLNRDKYVHLSGDKLTTDEIIPWGDDAVIEIRFDTASSSYNIMSSDGQFLSSSGLLKPTREEDCGYALEFQTTGFAFKNIAAGKYVTSLGASGLCKATKAAITKDETYTFENSYPQIKLKSATKGKYLSIAQGVEISASKAAANSNSDNEIFQLEPLGEDKWTIKSATDKLWAMKDGAVRSEIERPAKGAAVPAECVFILEFDGANIRIKASNGNYVSTLANSYLKASLPVADETCNFEWSLINRPRLVLRDAEVGFIRRTEKGNLKAVKGGQPYTFDFAVTDGQCTISSNTAQGVTYFKVADGRLVCTGSSAEFFFIELLPNSRLNIISADGQKVGVHAASGELTVGGAATGFEY